MDLHYYDKAAIPRVGQPEVGKIYAAQVSSDWHRVKVTEVRGIDCTCWFLDHGDEDAVPVEDLREIAPKFLELPPQAVSVQLAGLEDYSYSEALVQQLNSALLGKSLVGKVENRRSLGSSCVKSAKSSTKPRLVLFDTSSEDVDVNLNQKLIEQLVTQDAQSRLPPAGGEDVSVFVSYIAKNGDLFVQKESSTFTMIEKMIVEQGPEAMKADSASNIQAGKLYLAKYAEDGSLYRAEVLGEPEEDKVEVLFVDYGNSSRVAVGEVWELSTISEVMAELPRQALRCRLAQVPAPGHCWSEAATRALRDRVPESQLAVVRVVGQGGVSCRGGNRLGRTHAGRKLLQKLKKRALSTLGRWTYLNRLMGEHACQTPCRELLIPIRGQVRRTRVNWTLLSITSTSADEDTNQLVLIVVHLQT